MNENNINKRFYLRAIKRAPYRIYIILKFILYLFWVKKIEKIKIEIIRNRHSGETMYIYGSGPSLDSYPKNFLDGKLSMSLHMAYMKYKNPTYTHITESDRIEWFKENHPDFFNTQGLYCDPLFPLMPLDSILKDIDLKTPPYYLKYNPRALKINNIEKEFKAALLGRDFRYHSNNTCLHAAIWCAIILGFKTIEIIGCDFASKNGKHYSNDTNVKDTRQRPNEFFENAYIKMNIFTKEIINIAEKYNIEINRYLDYTDYKLNITTFD